MATAKQLIEGCNKHLHITNPVNQYVIIQVFNPLNLSGFFCLGTFPRFTPYLPNLTRAHANMGIFNRSQYSPVNQYVNVNLYIKIYVYK